MKILMRNVGMTLHVIHTLRAQGLDNVKVNMDWQHLIMNGESLGEYAALLAAEGSSATSTRTRAGARSTTTTWSARPRSWRRSSSRWSSVGPATERTASGSASTSTRTPRDAVAAVRRSVAPVAVHRLDRSADRRRRAPRGSDGEGRGARVRARLRGSRGMRLEQAQAIVSRSSEARPVPSRSSLPTRTASWSPRRRWTVRRTTRG